MLNAVVDILFAALPIAIIATSTAMPARQKASVCGLVALAGMGSLVSVVRIPFIATDTEVGPGVFANEVPVALLSVAETGVGICCLSVAALRPLARLWASKGRRVVEEVQEEVQVKRVKSKVVSLCSSDSWSMRSSVRKEEPKREIGCVEIASDSARRNEGRESWWTALASEGAENEYGNEVEDNRQWRLEEVERDDDSLSDAVERGLAVAGSNSPSSGSFD